MSTTIQAIPKGKQLCGIVVSSQRNVLKVRVPRQQWNDKIKKFFDAPYHVLARDTNMACRSGDTINIRSGFRTNRKIHHVVTQIVQPFGEPLSARPAVPSLEELQAAFRRQRLAKNRKRAEDGDKTAKERIRQYEAQIHNEITTHQNYLLKDLLATKASVFEPLDKAAQSLQKGDPPSSLDINGFKATLNKFNHDLEQLKLTLENDVKTRLELSGLVGECAFEKESIDQIPVSKPNKRRP